MARPGYVNQRHPDAKARDLLTPVLTSKPKKITVISGVVQTHPKSFIYSFSGICPKTLLQKALPKHQLHTKHAAAAFQEFVGAVFMYGKTGIP